MTTNETLRKHSNFNSDDYAYLAAKGWTDAEILERWDTEAKSGKGPCFWTGPARSKLTAVTGRK
ncbi:MAG: hypothetical protein DVS81_20575 [Candidatus Accumulibacter meliphilus]|jgi:hypothetical protein|uniref:Uncharacterized protein n=1 Tax=Candidatus Accumulibacter meliphilus TaxID=2211374 RepID=A0A369XF42_9PROT|nr:MAG: hypothetical protein DVS81_20575 [Candidatus Accumulibacter meliphilus]